MTRASPDTAGVIAPPPLLAGGAVVAGLVLERYVPIGALAAEPFAVRLALALAAIGVSAGVALSAVRGFFRAGIHVEPWRPTTALVTDGIYAHTRNPMYLALGLSQVGLGLLLGSEWILITTVAFAGVIHFGVVLREERYLERKFGEPYRRYRESVPRYGWRF